jgi:Ulp1 family protease
MNSILLFTYNDANIYNTDILSLEQGRWLLDNVITYAVKKLASSLSSPKIVVLDPNIVTYINFACDDEDEYDNARSGIGLSSSSSSSSSSPSYIISIVCNNSTINTINGNGCSHWSMLLTIIDNNNNNHKYYHFDSSANTNHHAACNTAKNINYLLNKDNNNVTIIPVQVPQQTNGSDCGIYTILFMEYIVSRINSIDDNDTNIETYIFSDISNSVSSPSLASEYRNVISAELILLAQQKLPLLQQELNDQNALLLSIESDDKLLKKTKEKIISLQTRYNTIETLIKK